MQPRKNIIEIFSTFVQFAGDRFGNWAIESKLRRSMQTCLNRTPQATSESEYFWSLYWYKFWQVTETQSLAREHLTAYLQESCYWVSQKTVASFASTQYQLSDCFQIAISQVEKILKAFNPNHSNLKNYATTIFSNSIRETLRQRHEIDICTDWGLLRKITKKRLLESLETAGLSPSDMSAYALAWECFKTFYVPTPTGTSRQLPPPDKETWNAIAKSYNSQSSQSVNPQTIEKWLLNTAKAIRKYLYPTLNSLNTPQAGDNSLEWLDNLPDLQQESLVNEIIAQEEEQTRNHQQNAINQVLTTAISQIEPQLQQILQLYYRQGLTQDKIAKQLEMQQYTVSRRLKKAQENLLKSLANWSRDTLHISITSDLLKNMSVVMEEWLQTYYCNS
ncbi:sigma-70 family RNA polymerase sigma factor [Anabaena azotica]|uniref:sigma-70 family RNA polymerase sigma factor n=1 Tax=Anabaena azotica TaxID=197653 RepID=UPI0039A4A364